MIQRLHLTEQVLYEVLVCRLDILTCCDHAALVGRHVHVYWESDRAWYRGLVTAFDPVALTHAVAYDDGERADEALYSQRVALECVPAEALPLPTVPQLVTLLACMRTCSRADRARVRPQCTLCCSAVLFRFAAPLCCPAVTHA